MHLRPLTRDDFTWLRAQLAHHFAGPRIWSRGVWFDADALPGLIAEERAARRSMLPSTPMGLCVHTPMRRASECEVIALAAVESGRGVGSALLNEIEQQAREASVARLFLTTTNDNTDALRFYQRRGWRIAAWHKDSMVRARAAKPEIPVEGHHGIEVRDEIELEWDGLRS